MTKNDTDEKALAPRQAKVIAALLTMPDVSSAAASADVPLSTVRRWMSSDEAFKRALQEAEREAIGNVTRRLAGVSKAAVAVILAIMKEPADSCERTPEGSTDGYRATHASA